VTRVTITAAIHEKMAIEPPRSETTDGVVVGGDSSRPASVFVFTLFAFDDDAMCARACEEKPINEQPAGDASGGGDRAANDEDRMVPRTRAAPCGRAGRAGRPAPTREDCQGGSSARDDREIDTRTLYYCRRCDCADYDWRLRKRALVRSEWNRQRRYADARRLLHVAVQIQRPYRSCCELLPVLWVPSLLPVDSTRVVRAQLPGCQNALQVRGLRLHGPTMRLVRHLRGPFRSLLPILFVLMPALRLVWALQALRARRRRR
jgi:hypothetical protein